MAFKKKLKIEPKVEPKIEPEQNIPEAPETPVPEAPIAPPAPAPKAPEAPAPEAPKAPDIAPATPSPAFGAKKEPSIAEKKLLTNPEFKSSETSMIQCRILSPVNAVIGRKRWVFAAGQIVKIPGSVYEILKQGKKAL